MKRLNFQFLFLTPGDGAISGECSLPAAPVRRPALRDAGVSAGAGERHGQDLPRRWRGVGVRGGPPFPAGSLPPGGDPRSAAAHTAPPSG